MTIQTALMAGSGLGGLWSPPWTGSPLARSNDTRRAEDIISARDWGSANDVTLQKALDYASANGRGKVFVNGTWNISSPVILPSGVVLIGDGRERASLVAGAGLTKILTDKQVTGQNNFNSGFRDIAFVCNGDTDIGVELTTTRYSEFTNFSVTGATKTNAVALKLHGYQDGAGGHHHAIRNRFCNILITGYYGVHLTRGPTYLGEDGANFNQFDMGHIQGFQAIGFWVEYGEGNRAWGLRNETGFDNTIAFKVGDAITTLSDCAADGVMFTAFVDLTGGSSGSVNQIEVHGTNTLAAPVAYNTSLRQTASDVVDAINANTGSSGYIAELATKVTDAHIHIFAEAGTKLDQPTTVIVLSLTTITGRSSYSLAGGNLGELNEWNFPRGRGGSNAIGWLVVEKGSATIINPQGNGFKDRISFENTNAQLSTTVLRASDMTFFGGDIRLSRHIYLNDGGAIKNLGNQAQLSFPVAPTLNPATGSWTISYAGHLGDYYRIGRDCYVWIDLTFTVVSVDTAAGQVSIGPLPFASLNVPGLHQDLRVGNIRNVVWPAGQTILGAEILGGATDVQIRTAQSAAVAQTLQVGAFPAGATEYRIRLSGIYVTDTVP